MAVRTIPRVSLREPTKTEKLHAPFAAHTFPCVALGEPSLKKALTRREPRAPSPALTIPYPIKYACKH